MIAIRINFFVLVSQTEDFEYNPRNTTANMLIHPQKKRQDKEGSSQSISSDRRRSGEKDGGSKTSMRDPGDGKRRSSKMKRASGRLTMPPITHSAI